MPYQGYWGLFGGKQISGETIPQTIEREVFEEASLKAQFQKYHGIMNEMLKENNQFKHSFLFILTSLKADSFEVKEQQEGKVAWFDYQDVINHKITRLIPSDVEFLKKYDEREIEIEHIVMEEQGENLILQPEQ